MSTQKPGRSYLQYPNESSQQGDHAISHDNAQADPVMKQAVTDLYKCGTGTLEVAAVVIGPEAFVVAPNLAAALTFSGMRDVVQGCVGLLCSGLSDTQTDNHKCHEALDYLDLAKQAGFLFGSVLMGGRQGATGPLFAAGGDAFEMVSKFSEGDYLGAAEKSLSLKEHADEFIDSINKHSEKDNATSSPSESIQNAKPPEQQKPGMGELGGPHGGWNRIGGGPGDAGGPKDDTMYA